MLTVRYMTTFVLSCLLSVSLFVLMQRMLTFDQSLVRKNDTTLGLDFVRLIREPPVVQKKRHVPIPKKPPPPKKKAPPPKLATLKTETPKINRVTQPAPRFQTKINLNDALFLGDFKKNAPVGISPSQPTFQTDEEVVPLVRIAPQYPRRAARLGLEGWVKLEVTINKSGTVDDAKVISALPRRTFNSAAIRAIKRWRFRPKVVNGQAVARKATQMIKFQLSK